MAAVLPIDLEVARVAAQNDGIVDHLELIALGLSRYEIRGRIERGRLHVLHRGVYAVGHRAISRRGRWIAALRAHGEGSLLARRSAAAHVGLSVIEGPRVEICRPPTGRRRRDGISVQAVELPVEDRSVHRGLPVVAAPRLLLDLAPIVGERRLRTLVAEASHRGLLPPDRLASLLERSAGRRGVRAMRLATEGYRDTEQTRSVPEASFVLLCRRFGLPDPAVNVPVGDLEVDFLWPQHRLIVEIDGFRPHGNRDRFEGDRERAVHFRLSSYEYLPFTPRQVNGRPDWVARCVATALRNAGWHGSPGRRERG